MPAFVPAMIRAVCGWAEPELLDTYEAGGDRPDGVP
jgi:hypothetical protein